MASLDEKMSSMAEQLLKRSLSESEKNEIYRIADAAGMRDVQSFLYLLLVFRLHEDTMNVKFAAMSELEKRIQEALESSAGRFSGGGADTGAPASLSEYHFLRGQALTACCTCAVSVLAYWLGSFNALAAVPPGGALEAFMFLPAGWCVFFGGAAHTFLWAGGHWGRVKKTVLYKTLLGLRVFLLAALGLALL